MNCKDTNNFSPDKIFLRVRERASSEGVGRSKGFVLRARCVAASSPPSTRRFPSFLPPISVPLLPYSAFRPPSDFHLPPRHILYHFNGSSTVFLR